MSSRAALAQANADPRRRDPVARGALVGAALGALVWLLAARLGAPEIAGLTETPALGVATAVGALLGLARVGRRLLGALAIVLGAVLAVVAFTPVMRGPALALVRRDPLPGPGEVDAVVSLSGNLTGDGRVGGEGVERLLDASALARRLQRPLVLTIVRDPRRPGVSTLEDQRALATLLGVGDSLVTVDSVYSTRDEARAVARAARQVGWTRVAVVTSPLHSRRACATFARAGLRVRCVPSVTREMALDGPAPLAGADERVRAFQLWLYEQAATALYRARGWI